MFKVKYVNIIYKNRKSSDYPNKLIKYLSNRLKLQPNTKLLDVGCGDGTFTKTFKESGIDSIGIDINEYDADIDNLPYKDNMFDVIFCKSVIEHISNYKLFLNECKRVLKQDGKLIILTPNWESQWKIFYEDPTHIHPYSKKSLYDLLLMFEFGEVESEIFYQYPLCWKFPLLKYFKIYLPIKIARLITNITGIKYFRWINETMILAIGNKV